MHIIGSILIKSENFRFEWWKDVQRFQEKYRYHIIVKDVTYFGKKNMLLMSEKLEILHKSKLPRAKKNIPLIVDIPNSHFLLSLTHWVLAGGGRSWCYKWYIYWQFKNWYHACKENCDSEKQCKKISTPAKELATSTGYPFANFLLFWGYIWPWNDDKTC